MPRGSGPHIFSAHSRGGAVSQGPLLSSFSVVHASDVRTACVACIDTTGGGGGGSCLEADRFDHPRQRFYSLVVGRGTLPCCSMGMKPSQSYGGLWLHARVHGEFPLRKTVGRGCCPLCSLSAPIVTYYLISPSPRG